MHVVFHSLWIIFETLRAPQNHLRLIGCDRRWLGLMWLRSSLRGWWCRWCCCRRCWRNAGQLLLGRCGRLDDCKGIPEFSVVPFRPKPKYRFRLRVAVVAMFTGLSDCCCCWRVRNEPLRSHDLSSSVADTLLMSLVALRCSAAALLAAVGSLVFSSAKCRVQTNEQMILNKMHVIATSERWNSNETKQCLIENTRNAQNMRW